MIKKIYMKDCATYDSIGASIEDCKKINFIYGANGSGKSTISQFLSCQDEPKYKNSYIEWDANGPLDIKVYNRKFREMNIHQSDIEGVFTIGKANIDEIQALEDAKKELKERKVRLAKSKETLAKEEEKSKKKKEQFREDVWNSIYKQHSKDFSDAFAGCRSSKDKFLQEVEHRMSNSNTNVKSLEILQEKAKVLYSSKPEMCKVFSLNLSTEIDLLEEIIDNGIWNTVIVGNNNIPIAKLINEIGSADWVRAGRKFLSKSSICPFCQKETIDEEFKKQLEMFFDKEYENNIQKVNELLCKYQAISSNILQKTNNLIIEERSFEIGKLDKELFESKLSVIMHTFNNNIGQIQEKLNEPSKKIELKNTRDEVAELLKMVFDANIVIQEHNNLVNNINEEKEKFVDDVWAYCINEQKALLDGYIRDITASNKAIEGIKKQYDTTFNEITKLEKEVIEKGKNITSVQPTVDEMNHILKTYGFNNFHIAPSKEKENYYQIQRQDGTLVNDTLSEGEETFISFLYFMQLTKGATVAERVSSKKIIVLDDPICSLDSTVLYIVSTMVKQLTEDIRAGVGDVEQLYIFTHNVFFHKEASFKDGRTKELKDVNYWIIRKELDVSKIFAYGMCNPISTSYELLWKELKEYNSSSVIAIQNIMRRIIENYFGLLGGGKEKYIKGKFGTVEEQMICESLFCWINDGSHSIPDDIFIDAYSDSIAKYKEVFYKIFKKTGHEAHYNMMMGIEDEH